MIHVHPRHAELIAASIDRPLDPDERTEVREHLIGCVGCRKLDHRLRADAAALSVPMHIPPPQRIQAELEHELTIPPLDPNLVRALRTAVAAALVLLVIVALAIGMALFEPRPTPPAETAEPAPAGLHLPEGYW